MKDHYLNKFKYFLKNQKGATTIEFFFMLLFLLAIFAFMVDLVILRSTLGKLDNASYTSVNILRERIQLYDKRASITAEDLEQFKQLSKRLLYGDKSSQEKVYVVLEYWPGPAQQATTLGDIADCPPYSPISQLSNLSPRSEFNNERKVPLYQVTLCVETSSFFKAFILNQTEGVNNLVRSSSMAVSR
ncbi:tight adherence pilus pseudopilin TadF [Glaesserella sp.]|uniref:tight adherence pilus pseudopilin TadF n=1 Tax=Glaesserella sp. TaxID=2094731 RepID=UPI0035A09780